MKPVQHEHTVEITIPEVLHGKIDHIRENKQSYLFGLGGIVIGVIGARLFSRSPVMVIIQNKEV